MWHCTHSPPSLKAAHRPQEAQNGRILQSDVIPSTIVKPHQLKKTTKKNNVTSKPSQQQELSACGHRRREYDAKINYKKKDDSKNNLDEMEWFHFFSPARTRGWPLYFRTTGRSVRPSHSLTSTSSKPCLGMDVVASRHCRSWLGTHSNPQMCPNQSLYQARWLAGGAGSSGHMTSWSNHSQHCTAISSQWSSIERHQICRLLQKKPRLADFLHNNTVIIIIIVIIIVIRLATCWFPSE